MPTNVEEDDHLLHHDIFIPNSDSNPSIPTSATTRYVPHQFPPKPNPNFLSLLLKAIIMVLIISLFFFFLGIATLALLHFFLAGGALHRRRRPTATTDQLPIGFSDAACYSVEDLQRYLPRLRYAATAGVPLMAEKDCAVCLEFFREGEWCRSLPECHHTFHASCVDKWLTKVANCPICRTHVRLNSRATGSVISNDDCKLLWAVGV
ncbi:RING-type E3 ubiquitin transferase [Sarracenia purpurea var. burkii]